MGARGSPLSLAQAGLVTAQLARASPGDSYEVVPIRTRGDSDPRPLFEMERRGAFSGEIDAAVASGEVHFAVHSLKDVPPGLADGLVLACVPRRGPVNDVLVSPGGGPLEGLPGGAVVGTSSLRRAVQARRLRPDLRVRPVRGNVGTRIQKAGGGGYDAVILAEAGILRLGLGARYSALAVPDFCPPPGQGALAAVARSGDAQTVRMLARIEDAGARAEAEAEMALSGALGSGCRFPVGALARADGAGLTLEARAFSVDGGREVRAALGGSASDPAALGRAVGAEMGRLGAGDLALNWREGLREWNAQ